MRYDLIDLEPQALDDETIFADPAEFEDAAAGELIGCLDRMVAEVSHNPELLEDLRWEIDLMKIRMGRSYLH